LKWQIKAKMINDFSEPANWRAAIEDFIDEGKRLAIMSRTPAATGHVALAASRDKHSKTGSLNGLFGLERE
jgi:hypothetical protein